MLHIPPAGVLVSIADRLDSLVGLVAVGCAPSGGADPLGLRRIAYGLLETLVANQQRLDLIAAVRAAASLLQCEVSQQSQVRYVTCDWRSIWHAAWKIQS